MVLGVLKLSSSLYSGTWELGAPKALSETVLNSEVVLFLRSISMWQIDPGTEVAVLNSQFGPISQLGLKTGFTVFDSKAAIIKPLTV